MRRHHLLLAVLLQPMLSAVNIEKLPLYFEPNRGQAEEAVRFLSRSRGYSLEITRRDVRLRQAGHLVRMRLDGAAEASSVEGIGRQAGTSNYLIGRDARKWRTAVPHYERVKLAAMYPGVDVVFYGNPKSVEYDFEVAAGADPGRIRMVWEGAGRPRFDRSGDVVMETPGGPLRLQRPRAWQTVEGKRREVAARFSVDRGGGVGFALGVWDRRYGLTIDPVLAYSGYIGGAAMDTANAVAVDSTGSAYVCGQTQGLPTTPSAAQPVIGGLGFDAFVAKISPDGLTLVYVTYIGGSAGDVAARIAVAQDGSAYVGGWTQSSNFPLAMPLQAARRGATDVFIAKLSPEGNRLIFATYFGGTDNTFERLRGIAVDTQGSVYVAGMTDAPDFPVTPGSFRTTPVGEVDGWIAKLKPELGTIVYSTLIDGANLDQTHDMVVDRAGNVLVVGRTDSWDFPGTPSISSRTSFVGKLNPSGSGLTARVKHFETPSMGVY